MPAWIISLLPSKGEYVLNSISTSFIGSLKNGFDVENYTESPRDNKPAVSSLRIINENVMYNFNTGVSDIILCVYIYW